MPVNYLSFDDPSLFKAYMDLNDEEVEVIRKRNTNIQYVYRIFWLRGRHFPNMQ